MFKLGLDLHGVLDTYYKELKPLIDKVLSVGGEVHIITGSENNNRLKDCM